MPKRTAFVESRSTSSLMPELAIGVGAFLAIYSGASTSPNVVPPNPPSIGVPTVTSQVGEILTIRWPITMASTGSTAASLTVDVFDAVDTAFATPLAAQQVITSGIGLGVIVNATFAGLDAMDGAIPRSFVIRAEVA